jgi:hypothetical protein
MSKRMITFGLTVAAFALMLIPAAFAAKTYYFICGHQIHGLSGLTGPSRTTYQVAQQDADSHVNMYPDHRGHASVNSSG